MPREETRRKEQMNEKSKGKSIKVQREKPLTPPRPIDVLIGEEEQTREKRKEPGVGLKPSHFRPFIHLLQPAWIIQ